MARGCAAPSEPAQRASGRACGVAVPVIVVTDSTSGLPAHLVDDAYLRIVPLHVLGGGEDYREGLDEVPSSPEKADDYSTSGAAQGELERVYAQALEQGGGDGVVAVHLSKAVSGTWDAARLAAEAVGPRVRVVDSGSAGLSVGMAALGTVAAARSGAGLDAVYETAVDACARAVSYIYIHRIDDLRRGGRAGISSALMTSALSVRILVRLGGGSLVLRERMRIPSKGLRRLTEEVFGEIDGYDRSDLRIAVQHWRAPERADALEEAVRRRLGADTPVIRGEFGPVLGLHLGPGAAGVAVLPEPGRTVPGPV